MAGCSSGGPVGDNFQVQQVTPELVSSLKTDHAKRYADKVPTPKESINPKPYSYKIGVGDIINIRVWGMESLRESDLQLYNLPEGQGWLVHEDGTIYLPYAGYIKVADLTMVEAQKAVTKELSKYFVKPRVEVSGLKYQSAIVNVTGEVGKPGIQYLSIESSTVLKALQRAEGLKETAAPRLATLRHADGTLVPLDLDALLNRGDARFNLALQPNDLIHVPYNKDDRVFVIGEVMVPSMLRMKQETMSLVEAITLSRGLNEVTADKGKVYVLRGAVVSDAGGDIKTSANHVDVYQLNVENPFYMALAEQFPLEPRDVIYVSARPVTEWSRFINQLLPMSVSPLTDPKRYE